MDGAIKHGGQRIFLPFCGLIFGYWKYASTRSFTALDRARRQRKDALLYASAITNLLRSSLANEFNAISDKHIAKAFPMEENAPLLCCCSKIGYLINN